ncbi:hypothetical protein EDD15DRAFT_2376339 [Pisolithus albus]|nr:hypothetical protein EDD15DRAFT_2376339 [Pisolithus albus]
MEAKQAMLEGGKARPVRPKWGVSQQRPTNICAAPHVDAAVDMEANTHCHVDTGLADAMRNVEATCALEQEESHQRFVINCFIMMLLLTESTLHWLNLIWNCSMPNRRAFLLGCINDWANEVPLSASNHNHQNSTASDSQTGGKSYPPSSTVPSLTSKATSVSSATSDVAPAYRKTPMPASNGSSGGENKDGTQDPTQALPVQIIGHHQPKMSRHPTSVNVNLQESDDDFDMPISTAAQAGTKHKHTGHHDSEVAVD